MTAPLKPQIAAKSLQKIKRESCARHAKADNRQRRKREKYKFSQYRRRAEHQLDGKQCDVRCKTIV